MHFVFLFLFWQTLAVVHFCFLSMIHNRPFWLDLLHLGWTFRSSLGWCSNWSVFGAIVNYPFEKCEFLTGIFQLYIVRCPVRSIPCFHLLPSNLRLILHIFNNMANQGKTKNKEEFKDIAIMQRRRLERVIDPIKYMLTVEATEFNNRTRSEFAAF